MNACLDTPRRGIRTSLGDDDVAVGQLPDTPFTPPQASTKPVRATYVMCLLTATMQVRILASEEEVALAVAIFPSEQFVFG
jgi:hypothetical protein